MNDDDFFQLSQEARELCIERTVPRIDVAELQRDPLLFLRDFVAQNRPVIITGALAHWRALDLWTHSYLRERLGDARVSVNATPAGFGDAVVRDVFVLPERRVMPFSRFIMQLERRTATTECANGDSEDVDGDEFGVREAALAAFGRPARTQARVARTGAGAASFEMHMCAASRACELCLHAFPPASIVTELPPSAVVSTSNENDDDGDGDDENTVLYLSEQNDCFRTEFADALAADVELDIPWASAAFGGAPEAINLWLGGDESVSAMHKDHYENMYAVVRGEKLFTLLAPVDAHFLDERIEFPVAKFASAAGCRRWYIVRDPSETRTPWIAADVECTADLRNNARAARIAPLAVRARVSAGEILYLPSLWFHRVAQCRGACESTVAVNFWYDMRFTTTFAYFNFAARASTAVAAAAAGATASENVNK